MKPKRIVSSLLGLVLLPAVGQAQVFLNENFDSYADQTAFQTAWPLNGTATTLLSTEQASSGNQSAKALTTPTRNARNIGELGFLNGTTDTIIFKFDFYDSDAAAGYRQYAELDDGLAPSSAGQLFALGVNNNIASSHYMARILGFDGGTGAGVFFKLDGVGAPTRTTGWHTLEAHISDNAVNYYVDGILAKTLNTAALTDRSLETVKIGSNLSSTRVAYFDNIYVARVAVPEPGAMGLVLVGLAAAAWKNRRLTKP